MLSTLTTTDSHDDVLECLDRDGAVIIKDLAPAALVERLQHDIDPQFDEHPGSKEENTGKPFELAVQLSAWLDEVQRSSMFSD